MKKIMMAVMLIQIINGSTTMAQTQTGLQINPFYNKAPLTLNMGLIPLSGGVPTATFVVGSRLDGFDNHPMQITGIASGLIDGIDGVGVGLKINNESAGLSNNTDAQLGFGYFVYTDKEKGDKLSFALSGHFIQNTLSREGILVLDPNDPNLANISQVQPTGNASASIAFIRENKYYAGISAYQLIKNQNAFMNAGWKNYSQRTYYFVGAYTFELNEKLALEVSGAAVYANAKTYAYDGGVDLKINKMFWAGIGYRSAGALKFNFGVTAQSWSFGYMCVYGSWVDAKAYTNKTVSNNIMVRKIFNEGRRNK